MNIALKPELQRFVDTQLKKGRYKSIDDLFAAAVARLMQDDSDIDFAPGELEKLIAEGEADIAKGNVMSLDEVRKRFQQRRQGASN